MEPRHLARLDDDGSAPLDGPGLAGGPTAASPESPEVPVLAPVLPFSRSLTRSRRRLGATPLHVSGLCPAGPAIRRAW